MVSKSSPPGARRERRALSRNLRGAPGNPPGRFEVLHIEPESDETCAPDDPASVRGVPTLYFRDTSRWHRQANAALHRTVVVRMRLHQPTVDDVARRTAGGRTSREIIRCLKRFLAREIYQRVMADFRMRRHVTQAAYR